ncbi:SHOCT domain-containing protein [Nesterenkonia alkaliphila]|uniref:SHOCT domain-containing protein n=2 Tax=Nesterenkonia alkaliphila TaxID=1463631 RepID=A0A7K1UM75_9MICC|nr:SHOCT domain-containing protein [Nesterenkonia alkaliphila]MVT27151.1 SHOCT domain-containing protein [Nesterenkonia alkaliphila]
MDWGGTGGMVQMWIFGLLVLLGVILLVIVVVKAFTGGSSTTAGSGATGEVGAGPGRARVILDERYARGEIDTEEYQERLRTLEEDGR